ncbi:ATP-grasp domain-containing protein [Plesiomonas sp.]|uniref:ATP-grasp domain-containing protein n=1 Tax=Plesiomonas sp. TaxID=2486279 RepID=UPI003F3E9A3E
MKLLCIGAGEEQLPFIEHAISQGHLVYSFDKNQNASGLSNSTQGYHLPDDFNELCQIIDDIQPDGILPVPQGRLLSLTGKLNNKYNWNGISEEAAEIFTDKELFFENLKSVITTPQTISRPINEVNTSIIREIPLPLILKPKYGSGSRGVVVIKKPNELDKSLAFCKEQAIEKNEIFIIQPFMVGVEHSIDGYIQNNKFRAICIREKEISPLPWRQEIGYIYPAKVSTDVENKIYTEMQKLTDRLALNNCMLNADILVNKDEIIIIEASGRPGGLSLQSTIIKKISNIHPIDISLMLIKGEDITSKLDINKKMFLYLGFFDGNGKVNILETKNYSGFIDYKPRFKENDVLSRIKTGKDISSRGYFFIKGRTKIECLELKDKIINNTFKHDNSYNN